MRNLLTVTLLLVLLTGCATPYMSRGNSDIGYLETQIGENKFEVSFTGSEFDSKERISDLALLRSAEVATENGFRYFIITYSNTGYHYPPSRGYTMNLTTGAVTPNTSMRTRTTTNKISCYKENPGSEYQVVDAENIKKSLKQKYGITK